QRGMSGESDSAWADDQTAVEYGDAPAEAGWDPAHVPVAGNGADGAAPTTRPSRARPSRPAAGPPPGPDDEAGRKTKRQVTILSILSAVVVLVGVLGFVLSRGASKKGAESSVSTSSV